MSRRLRRWRRRGRRLEQEMSEKKAAENETVEKEGGEESLDSASPSHVRFVSPAIAYLRFEPLRRPKSAQAVALGTTLSLSRSGSNLVRARVSGPCSQQVLYLYQVSAGGVCSCTGSHDKLTSDIPTMERPIDAPQDVCCVEEVWVHNFQYGSCPNGEDGQMFSWWRLPCLRGYEYPWKALSVIPV